MPASLFFATFSQTLQACAPIAVALAWFERAGDARIARAIRRGLWLSIPATAAGSWLFRQSVHQALDEALLASCAIAITAIAVRRESRRALPVWTISILAMLIVVRQSMEIGSLARTLQEVAALPAARRA